MKNGFRFPKQKFLRRQTYLRMMVTINLKKVFHIFVMLALPYSSFTQSGGKYTITGNLPAYVNSKNDITAFLSNDADQNVSDYKVDSTKVINGSFQFGGSLTQPRQGWL